jgi:hypothetical protein
MANYKSVKKSTKPKSKRKSKSKPKSNVSFFFKPEDPSKSFDVYIDKNPKDTIPIKYTTLNDVKNTIKKLEKLYKNGSYSHKRIGQVAMILRVRLRVLKDKKPKQFILASKYTKFLKERTKLKTFNERKKMKFTT